MLVHHRSVLPEVLEDERLQSQERLAGSVPIKIHAQCRLRRAAARHASRSDADIAHAQATPLEVGGVVGVIEVVLVKRAELSGVHRKTDLLERLRVEEVRGRRSLRLAGGAQEDYSGQCRDDDMDSVHGVDSNGELEPEYPAPEGRAGWRRTIGRFGDGLANEIHLQLDPPVDVPVHAERADAIGVAENDIRARAGGRHAVRRDGPRSGCFRSARPLRLHRIRPAAGAGEDEGARPPSRHP